MFNSPCFFKIIPFSKTNHAQHIYYLTYADSGILKRAISTFIHIQHTRLLLLQQSHFPHSDKTTPNVPTLLPSPRSRQRTRFRAIQIEARLPFVWGQIRFYIAKLCIGVYTTLFYHLLLGNMRISAAAFSTIFSDIKQRFGQIRTSTCFQIGRLPLC